jgi:hypothetical protein
MTAIDPDVQAVLEQVDANSTSALALGLALLRGLQDRDWPLTCGAKGTRTPGLLDANQTLFQLSYSPEMPSVKGTATTDQRGLFRRQPGAAGRDSSAYFSSRESRRSARGFPPVWQVGQYCSAESANETSLIVSPQAGHS